MKEQKNNIGLQFIVALILFTFLFSHTANAQGTVTGFGQGNVNTIFADGGKLYAGGNNGFHVIISFDDGATWNEASTGIISNSDVRASERNRYLCWDCTRCLPI